MIARDLIQKLADHDLTLRVEFRVTTGGKSIDLEPDEIRRINDNGRPRLIVECEEFFIKHEIELEK